MDLWFEGDWGAAIINTGVVSCTHCTFVNNYAKNGGAIFNMFMLYRFLVFSILLLSGLGGLTYYVAY